MLKVEHISLAFRGVKALRDVSMEARRGEVTALIGPNGAGKTTLFNCINRIIDPDAGTIWLGEDNVTGLRPASLAARGVARTFQHAALFPSLTVLDNVRVGSDLAHQAGRTDSARSAEDVLELLGLTEIASSAVDGLPLGTKKRVEIARAIASGPRVLLLDEPAGGLTHEEVAEMRDMLLQTKEELGLTLLLVEHHVDMVMTMSNVVVVLSSGEVIAQGTPREIQSNPAVIEAYLGGAA